MATLDYVDIPPGATRLRSPSSPSSTPNNPAAKKTSSDIRPAPTIYTSLPNPSPPNAPRGHRTQNSLSMSLASLSSGANPLTSPTALGFIPQLILSSSFPGIPGGTAAEDGGIAGGSTAQPPGGSNPRQKLDLEKYTLLSTRDPLSLPIMTNNFKRFVSKVGPVFWLQDRVEEIVLWKKGWKLTGTWMALYAFLCYYPRFVFLLPHVALISIILSTYTYPASSPSTFTPHSSSSANPANATSNTSETPPAPPSNATEGSIPWQANIQAIQNLMGFVSDAFTAAEPYLYHFVLSSAHFREPPSRFPSSSSNTPSAAARSTTSSSTPSSSSGTTAPTSTTPISPYTPHLLTLLIVTFPVLLFIVSLPSFPVREVCLVGGLAPFVVTHPYVRRISPWLGVYGAFILKVGVGRVEEVLERFRNEGLAGLIKGVGVSVGVLKPSKSALVEGKDAGEDEEQTKKTKLKALSTIVQRVIDTDRLTDRAWNSEMSEVELWENERFGGDDPTTSSTSTSIADSSASGGNGSGNSGWSKANLKFGERTGWTRGMDGLSEVSNLTFSLAPGWAFVETEDWRKDLVGAWAGVEGCDEDGWVYTNDAWLGSRPAPYVSGGGSVKSVTRRRRWVRRVWFDPELFKREQGGNV